jgi:hypothetical protein
MTFIGPDKQYVAVYPAPVAGMASRWRRGCRTLTRSGRWEPWAWPKAGLDKATTNGGAVHVFAFE